MMTNKQLSLFRILLLLVTISAGCELPPVRVIQQTNGGQVQPNRADRPGGGPLSDAPAPDTAKTSHSTHWLQISSSNDTFFKTERLDSTQLEKSQKCLLPKGTRHNLAQAPEWLGNHVKIELKRPMAGCGFTQGWVFSSHIDSSSDSGLGPVLSTHTSEATLYTTENTAMEGGPKDRCGRPLSTLVDYLNGDAEVVSVAMDSMALPYGTLIRIPEIEKRFALKEAIPFKVVDTGSAFIGRGLARMDICVGHDQKTIFSPDFIWISHKSFEIHVISRGQSFDCR
jgi:3D (Asp-Asp-Asp) domain-containing protein